MKKRDTPWLVKHGRSRDPIYKIWTAMKQRCENPKVKGWENYGGRGIAVCGRWMQFENFAKDMGDRPRGGTLERKDNNAHYEPRNCRWATRSEQSNNIRCNRVLIVRGVSKTVRQWEFSLGFKRGTISSRLRLGWTPEEAALTPPSHGNRPNRRAVA